MNYLTNQSTTIIHPLPPVGVVGHFMFTVSNRVFMKNSKVVDLQQQPTMYNFDKDVFSLEQAYAYAAAHIHNGDTSMPTASFDFQGKRRKSAN